MSKIIYDVIQRFEVENGVPRLVSTNIQVIQGGEDLMSLATSLLDKLGFYDKFDESRTSQYVGYKLKNPKKGAKRYQLVLTPRKEGLCVTISRDILKSNILYFEYFHDSNEYNEPHHSILGKIWVLPSKENIFFESMQARYPIFLEIGETTGIFILNMYEASEYYGYEISDENSISRDLKAQNVINLPEEFDINNLGGSNCYLVINDDKLFPYSWQVCITSSEVLKEFLGYFAKILMEQQ